MLQTLPYFLATGALAGLIAGLFGVGGGLIMVPTLAFLLPALGVDPAITMQVAIGTSLGVISVTSVSSVLAHHRRGGVLWPVFLDLAPGLACGAVLGAVAAHLLDGLVLKRIVGGGALLVAMQMLRGQRAADIPGRPLPGRAGLMGAGTIIGALAALIGIGGGAMTVPLLSWFRVEMRQAVGTSAAAGMPIAWAGTLGFIVAGWGASGVLQPNLGYLSVPAFAGLAAASVLAAPLGARLAHGLPAAVLKRAFAVLLLAIGIGMLAA